MMDSELLDKLLYEIEDTEAILKGISKLDDEEMLFAYCCEYNWDDGFEIPQAILEHKKCTLAIALLLFYEGDGLSYLFSKDEADDVEDSDEDWYAFIENLYNQIKDGRYHLGEVHYENPLTKVEKYKINKIGVPAIFIEDI